MTENTNNEEYSEVIQTKKMDSVPRQQPEVFELKCQSCGVLGELEEYMDEFDCPQCGGKMYPVDKTKKAATETTRLSSEEQENLEQTKLEQETATISISKAQINEYKKNIKVAKPVDIGIFSSGVPSISSSKGMSTSSKNLNTTTPSSAFRSIPAKQSNIGLPPVTRSITTGIQTPPTNTATRILPDPILERELEALQQRKEYEERARKSKDSGIDLTKTRVEIDMQPPLEETSMAQKFEIERLRAEGLEKLLQEETFMAEQEKERLRLEQETQQQEFLEAQEALRQAQEAQQQEFLNAQEVLRREREEFEKKKIELEELERKFQSASQDEPEIPAAIEEEPIIQDQPAVRTLDNKKLIIIIASAVLFMILFGIIVFMIGKSSASKTSDSVHGQFQKFSSIDDQWRGRHKLI